MVLFQRLHLIALLFLALICYLAFFHRLGTYGLWDPDEGRSAVIAKEIVDSGHWATLTFNKGSYYDKPAFFFWLVALGFKVLGLNELAVRLPSAVAGTLTVGMIFLYGAASGGWRRGLWGAAVLATSMEFIALGRLGKMDMLFTFFFTAGLLSFLWWLKQGQVKAWIYLFYSLLALATLTKGPVGIILPFLIVGSFLALGNQWKILGGMRLLSGLLLTVLIAGPWYLAAFFQDPAYIKTFFWDHNVLRYVTAGPGINHPQPVYYLLPILLAGFLPWSLYLPAMTNYFWRKSEGNREEISFLLLWVIIIFVFFSLSRNKLGTYVLPAFPPLALLTADFLRQSLDAAETKPWLRRWILGASFFWLLLLVFLSSLVDPFLSHYYPAYPRFDLPSLPAVFLILMGAVGWFLGRKRWVPWVISFSCLWLVVWFYGAKADEISELRGAQKLAQVVIRNVPEGLRVVAITGESFVFYLPHHVQMAAHPGQIENMLQESIPTVALIKEKHIREIERVDPGKFFIWKTIPSRNALVANFPMSTAEDLGKVLRP